MKVYGVGSPLVRNIRTPGGDCCSMSTYLVSLMSLGV